MVLGSLGLVAVERIAFWTEVAEACLGVGVELSTRAAESHVYHCCAP